MPSAEVCKSVIEGTKHDGVSFTESNTVYSDDDAGKQKATEFINDFKGRYPDNSTSADIEECYLYYNTDAPSSRDEGSGSQYFYKPSYLIPDLKGYVNKYFDPGEVVTSDIEYNVCGENYYIDESMDPTNNDFNASCVPCSSSGINSEIREDLPAPSDKYNTEDYTLKTNVDGDFTTIGIIKGKKLGDFKQDHLMYLYDLDQETLNANKSSNEENTYLFTDELGNTVKEKSQNVDNQNNKLDIFQFTNIQKQCSPLISTWFPHQHELNAGKERENLFDLNAIRNSEVFERSDLLQDNPISIVDFINREYNSAPELDGLPEQIISEEMLQNDGILSILNNIRVLDVDIKNPMSNEQMLANHQDKLVRCNGFSELNPKCSSFGGQDGTLYYKTIPEELARAWIAKKLDRLRSEFLQTQDGNISTLYSDLSGMLGNINPQVEECLNDIVGKDENSQESIQRLKNVNGDFTQLLPEDVQYIKRKIVMFIHSPDDEIRRCIDMLYLNQSDNLCTEGLYNKTLKILTILFSLLGINVSLDDIEYNKQKYNRVMSFVDSLGHLFPKAIEKIINIIQDLEKDLCNTSNRSDIIANLYDDLMNKNRKYNIELGVFGQLFSLDDNQYSRIVDTYNMVKPVLGRLFGPSVSE